MSASHTLTITPAVSWPEDQLALVEARVRSLLAVEGVEEAFTTSDYAGLEVSPEEMLLWFENRWTMDALHHVGRRISRSYLYAEVVVEISWDTRDADESGSELRRYRDGELVAEGGTEVVVRPVVAPTTEPDLIGKHVFGGPESSAYDRGWEMVKAYASQADIDDDLSLVIGDIVTDLMHLARRQSLDFEDIHANALSHHLDEQD